jgi:hypothetical protein
MSRHRGEVAAMLPVPSLPADSSATSGYQDLLEENTP